MPHSLEDRPLLNQFYRLMLHFFFIQLTVRGDGTALRVLFMRSPVLLLVPGGEEDRAQGLDEDGPEGRKQDDGEDGHGEDLFAPGDDLGCEASAPGAGQEYGT